MNKLGLILNMMGVIILGFQPYDTLWDAGTRAKVGWLNALGWGCLFIGFLLMLVAEFRKNR